MEIVEEKQESPLPTLTPFNYYGKICTECLSLPHFIDGALHVASLRSGLLLQHFIILEKFAHYLLWVFFRKLKNWMKDFKNFKLEETEAILTPSM